MKNKTYEYQTTILSLDRTTEEDYSVLLEVVSFTSGPEAEIKWCTDDDISWMGSHQLQKMEEWLSIEHQEYIEGRHH